MKIFKFRDIIFQLPNIILRRSLRFNFELLPFEVKELRLKKIINFFIAGLNQYVVPSKPLGYPVIAQVEPANICNLSCPLCYTTSQNKSRPSGVLPFSTFKKLIDEVGDYLLLIVLWNWGEPFLNPAIFEIIKYAKSKNIVVHSSTNGNLEFDDKKAEKLVDSGLDSLVFAVDGATQETYSKYRIGGNLDQVLANIRTIVSVKKRKGSETPRLNLRVVVSQHNEKELPLIRKIAEELGVDFLTFKTMSMISNFGENLDSTYVPENTKYRMYEYESKSFKRKQRSFTCMRPWKRVTLDALGEIIPCEYEYKSRHSFGSISTEKPVISVWKGNVSKDFRKRFNLGNNEFYLCKNCVYKNMVDDDCTVEKINILPSN